LDEASETLLPGIKINGDDAVTGFHQCKSNMHSDGGFTRATFLIANYNDMRRLSEFLVRLDQQGTPP
jgi:hypothetical protein